MVIKRNIVELVFFVSYNQSIMDWSKVKRTDIGSVSTFNRGKDTFTKLAESQDKRYQVWKRGINDSGVVYDAIEVIKAKKQGDGTLIYPSTEQFGTYGYCFPYNERNLAWAMWLMENGFPDSSEYISQYKRWKAQINGL